MHQSTSRQDGFSNSHKKEEKNDTVPTPLHRRRRQIEIRDHLENLETPIPRKDYRASFEEMLLNASLEAGPLLFLGLGRNRERS